jgi:hypothetical protein
MHVLLRIVDNPLSVARDVIDELPNSGRIVQSQVVVTRPGCRVQIMNK